MIGYVFWHQKIDSVASSDYEKTLKDFHEKLMHAGIRGYLGSVSLKIEGAHWIGSKKSGYEDWYYMTDSGVIDILNHGAVSGDMMPIHNNAAGLATGMHAGLYQLKSPSAKHKESQWCIWFSKPGGKSYDDFDRMIASAVPANSIDIWRRQMVLGPTPEFCIISDKRIDLDPETKPEYVKRTVILKFAA
ncbi:MAG: hypothetical protein ACP5OC_07605 [Thermoplasmata archaeon]